jgi:hypothetical protein
VSSTFQPPPTYALPVIVDELTGRSVFNPIWLKWFIDLSSGLGSVGAGSGTVTSVTAGTGLSGGPITSTGALSLSNVGTPGTYVKTTFDAQGRETSGSTTLDLATDVTGTLATTHLSGFSGTVTTAKLTPGGANGSMTFTNGLLTASTAAT